MFLDISLDVGEGRAATSSSGPGKGDAAKPTRHDAWLRVTTALRVGGRRGQFVDEVVHSIAGVALHP